jgi:hypothetical protein
MLRHAGKSPFQLTLAMFVFEIQKGERVFILDCQPGVN